MKQQQKMVLKKYFRMNSTYEKGFPEKSFLGGRVGHSGNRPTRQKVVVYSVCSYKTNLVCFFLFNPFIKWKIGFMKSLSNVASYRLPFLADLGKDRGFSINTVVINKKIN